MGDDVFRFWGGQKNGHSGQILCAAHTAKGDRRANLTLFLAWGLAFVFGKEGIHPVPMFAVNVSGTLFCLQAAARHMIARGKGGKIINMASQAGRRGEGLVAVYCASKAAVISLTQSAGLGLIEHQINVNAIAPGVVDGEHWDGVDAFFAKYEGKAPGQKKREVGAAVPFGRMGTAQDLIGMAIFLATPEADYIVAQCFGVDGGNWMA